jgi:hypothetical protein
VFLRRNPKIMGGAKMRFELKMCEECKFKSFCKKRKVYCEEYLILKKALEK